VSARSEPEHLFLPKMMPTFSNSLEVSISLVMVTHLVDVYVHVLLISTLWGIDQNPLFFHSTFHHESNVE
jgi:hypothetical protein